MDAVAVRWARPGKSETNVQLHLTPSSHAFCNQGTFVCCHGTAHVQQEVVMRVLGHRLIEKVALTTIALAFLKQHHVMDIVASQTIRTRDQHSLDQTLSSLIAKPIEARSIEGRTTLALITEDQRGASQLVLVFKTSLKSFDVLLNGLGLGLPVG